MPGSHASPGLTLDAAGIPLVDGQPLKLPPKERAVLALLLRRRGGVVSKNEFAAAAWRRGPMSDESLARCISQVRRSVGALGLKIEVLYGLGYRLLDASADSAAPAAPSAEALAVQAHVRHLLHQRSPASALQAIERARPLIQAEPGFAAARISLAEALTVAVNWGLLPTTPAVAEGLQVLEPVKTREPGLHAARGALLDMGWRFEEAGRCFEQALAQDGDHPETLLACGRHLLFTDQAARAVDLLRRVRQLLPHSLAARLNLARALLQAGRGNDALAELQAAQADHPGQLVLQAVSLSIQVMVAPGPELERAATRLTDGLDTPAFIWTVAAFVLSRLGRREAALDIIDSALLCSSSTAGEASLYSASLAALGEHDRAAELLERAAAERSGMLALMLRDPAHADWLPHHPRGRALLAQVFGGAAG